MTLFPFQYAFAIERSVFLVVRAPVRDLLLFAKNLFVAAKKCVA